jgi:hypothetical protein
MWPSCSAAVASACRPCAIAFQLEEKARELLRGFKFELGMLAAQPF